MFLYQTKDNSKNCILKIFDLEDEKMYEKLINLSIISSINNFNQINGFNCLYLCGIEQNIINESNKIGSYLLKINFDEYKINILVNSIFPHVNPSLLIYKKEKLIVIGGKEQIDCEFYNIKDSFWKELPFLPEDRFKCSIIEDELNDNIYIFGGFSIIKKKNMTTILKLNMNIMNEWKILNIKENENYLARNSSICLNFDDSDNILILGGYDNKNEKTEYIIEYNYEQNSIKKLNKNLNKISSFDLQGNVNLHKNYFVFLDIDNYIHIIKKKDFNFSLININDININNII